MSDAFWEQVRPLIPPAPSPAKEAGASSTVHDRFQEWERAGFFKALWQAGLSEYDELVGIEWEWQAVDGVLTKAPFAGAATGANPTDRGKAGPKRSLLTDGAGIPLALIVDAANRHDVRLLSATLDGLVISRTATHRRAATASVPGCRPRLD